MALTKSSKLHSSLSSKPTVKSHGRQQRPHRQKLPRLLDSDVAHSSRVCPALGCSTILVSVRTSRPLGPGEDTRRGPDE